MQKVSGLDIPQFRGIRLRGRRNIISRAAYAEKEFLAVRRKRRPAHVVNAVESSNDFSGIDIPDCRGLHAKR